MTNGLIKIEGGTDRDEFERSILRRFSMQFTTTTILAVAAILSTAAAWYGQVQISTQIEQSAAEYEHERFTKSITELSQLLSELYYVNGLSGRYDPVTILAGKSGVVMALDGSVSSDRSFVVDESETALKQHQFVIRLQSEAHQQAICGETDLAYKAVNNGSDFLTAYQRATRLEAANPDEVLSSEYLVLSRFAFAFAGIDEAEHYLDKAVKVTEDQEDGPGKALMNAEIAAIKVMYQEGDSQDIGRKLFREAERTLIEDDAAGAAVCLVDLYLKWAVSEHHVRNRNAADLATQKLFAAIDDLPARQTTKNRYVLDAAAKILSEMSLANGTLAEISLPDVFRMRDHDAQWKTLTVADVGNDFANFDHQRLRHFEGGGSELVMRPASIDTADLAPVPAPAIESGDSILIKEKAEPDRRPGI